MKKREIDNFRHPASRKSLHLMSDDNMHEDVESGFLADDDGHDIPIVRHIPRFSAEQNYAENFGYQWNYYATTQLDSETTFSDRSAERLFQTTGWPIDMKGQRLLEAGSGMGRFTQPLAQTGADVCTFDYSVAIDVNLKNNAGHDNVCFAQADIYAPPYEDGSFDKVLCLGVLQHCPSPKKAFLSLTRFLKPGGEICVDIYPLNWRCLFLGKYYIRPITRLLSAELLHRFVKFHVGWVFPITRALYKKIGRPASALSWALAVADFQQHVDADDATLKELAMLDTLDMLAPAYDRPATVGQVRRWCEQAGLVDIQVDRKWNVIAHARRPT